MTTHKRRVAIACQGGGSHTAFTAGVLSRFLQPDVLADHDIVGLSGTSGGAICATLAWSALLQGRPQDAATLLQDFWEANSARSPQERYLNSMVMWGSRLAEYITTPAISPYLHTGAVWTSNQLRQMVDQTVDVAADQSRALAQGDDAPLLVLGAVDAVQGSFRAFNSRNGDISTDAILASAAIPNLFRSVRIGSGIYWDGLFSQNPPIRDLRASNPDEIWVIQINPTTIDTEPKSMSEITNRRNELAGNLSLQQELTFIEQLNDWLADGTVSSDDVGHITVRILERARTETTKTWGVASKMNRDPQFLAELIDLGKSQAELQINGMLFEDAWDGTDLGRFMSMFAPDALVSSDHPRALLAPTRDHRKVADFVKALTLEIDASRARICHDNVRWEVRSDEDRTFHGQVLASFDNGLANRVIVTGSD